MLVNASIMFSVLFISVIISWRTRYRSSSAEEATSSSTNLSHQQQVIEHQALQYCLWTSYYEAYFHQVGSKSSSPYQALDSGISFRFWYQVVTSFQYPRPISSRRHKHLFWLSSPSELEESSFKFPQVFQAATTFVYPIVSILNTYFFRYQASIKPVPEFLTLSTK